jgi:2-phosphoglycolate phosphatase
MRDLRAVLFDLDGTLADTAPDLADALNKVLAEESQPPVPFHLIRPQVSHGATALIRLGFGIEPDQPKFGVLRERLLQHYAADVCRATRVFPGIPQLLAQLAARGIQWGIVTNKPAFLTDPLVQRLGLIQAPACVVSGDTTKNRKPHPEPLLHACAVARVTPAECVYVGDAERDIRAGRDAGMETLVALFGYIGENETPSTWGADAMVHEPLEILDWLNDAGRQRHVD